MHKRVCVSVLVFETRHYIVDLIIYPFKQCLHVFYVNIVPHTISPCY